MHVDSHMDPNYESAEETDEKRTGIYLPVMLMLQVACWLINIGM